MWNGESAVVIELRYGLFVGWETFWDPTGDGFYRGAYGGYTDLVFATSPHKILPYLGEDARLRIG